MPTPSPLTVIAIATALPGKEKALRAAQEKLVAGTLKEPGCLRYELHQSLDDGRILMFVETWASEALWSDHRQGAAINEFKASGAGALLQDIKVHRLEKVAG